MWRLNCPDNEVLMIEKRSLAMRKVSGSVSNDVPSTLLSHSAICAHWRPPMSACGWWGSPALWPEQHRVDNETLAEEGHQSDDSDCHHPSHQMRAQGVDVLEKVISVDSGSFFFMFICLPPRNRCDYSVFPESDLSPGLLSSAV